MNLNLKVFFVLSLVFCVIVAAIVPAAYAETPPALDVFLDRYGSLLEDGLDSLTDWLDGHAASLAPELRKTLQDIDTDALLSDLTELVAETRGMEDDALRDAILALAEKHGVHLVDSQVSQLMKLCRTLENLDTRQLRERTDALRDALETPDGLRGVLHTVARAVSDAANWLVRTVGGWFGAA